MEPVIHLRFLGTVQAEQDGAKIQGFRSRKALALLGYLAVQQHPVTREHLVDLLWSDQTESQGRANLSWVLNHISKYLPGYVATDRHTIHRHQDGSYWLDVEAFTELAEQDEPAAWENAVPLYRGEFLEGLFLDGCEQFESWVTGEREHWRQRVINILQKLIAHFSLQGEHERSLHFANRLLGLEPWREETHRQVMHLLARRGQRSAALAQYKACRHILADELDVEPDEDTTALFERIQAADTLRRHNLPVQPTPFVGREKELHDLIGLLGSPDCRLLTVLGPGGIGKTRLALQAAEAKADAFLEGVCFVPTVGVSSPSYLVSAIADALQISLSGAQPSQVQLLNYLRGKEMLLILDSFEHLLEDVGLLEEILQKAPAVKLLVTSRGCLNLRWEQCFELDGLSYPQSETAQVKLESYDSVQLLVQTASRVQHQFSLSRQNRTAIARICRLVEGMPLGIELAAAWARTHTCQEIAAEIEKDMGFLTTSFRDMPDRHKSMWVAFEHSWNLLTPAEQSAFMQLSVFRGGFSLEAASEVTGASPDILASLTDKSLIRLLSSGRYEIHELLRQYGAEKLAALPDIANAVRDRHCTYYTSLLQHYESSLTNTVPGTLPMVRVEIENIRMSWHWAVTKNKRDEIGNSIGGLSRFHLLTGLSQEGETLIEIAIAHVQELVVDAGGPNRDTQILLSKLLVELSDLLIAQGQYDQGIATAQKTIHLAQNHGALQVEARSHLLWALALFFKGDYQGVRLRLEQTLALAQSAHLEREEADSLYLLGAVSDCTHRYTEVVPYYEQALSIHRKIGSCLGEGRVLSGLGLHFGSQGDYAKAKAWQEQAIHLFQKSDNKRGVSLPLINLGYVCHQLGDYATAKDCYKRTLSAAREFGELPSQSLALSCLCLLSHHLGDNTSALKYGRQALSGVQTIGERRVQGYALTRLGHALAGLGRLSEAMGIYQQAYDLRQELSQHNLAMESLAGLVRVSLAQGHLAEAQTQVQEILTHLETGTLEGTDEPILIYLSCYHILQANHDPRADEILSSAYDLLQEQAARIDDKELRRSFLENIAAHREIMEIVERGDSTLDRVG